MNTTSKISLTVLVFGLASLLAAVAEAKPLRVPVTAFGSGSDTDQGAAQSAAASNAQGMLVCTGSLENVQTSSTGCVLVEGLYNCTAVAHATCVIGS